MIQEKVKLLDMIKEGQSYAAVARHYGMNESTVRYIKKEEKNIRTTASLSINQTAKRVVCTRNKNIVKMETALALWIQDCQKKNITLNGNIIRSQAKKLYDTFAHQGGAAQAQQSDRDNPDDLQSSTSSSGNFSGFSASKGWFDRFQKRFQLKSVSLVKLLGGESFQDMTQDNANDLIENHSPPLTDEDLSELIKSVSEEEVEELEEEEEKEDEGLSLERLGRAMHTANDLKQMLAEWDPDMARSIQFQNSIDGAIQVYKDLLTQKKKHSHQRPITTFFTRQKKAASTTSTSTATHVEVEALEQQQDDPPTPEEVPAEEAPSEEP